MGRKNRKKRISAIKNVVQKKSEMQIEKCCQLRLSRRQVVVESGLVWRHVLASQVSI